MSTGPRTRLVIVDDQTVFREMLAEVLASEGFEVVAQLERGEDALRVCERERPHVVVLDVVLPDMSGLDVLRELGKRVRGIAVLLVTAHEGTVVRDGVELGARGIVSKSAPLRELKDAVRRVAEGGVYFCQASSLQLHDAVRTGKPQVPSLTSRERQVLQHVALGLTSKEIAAKLGVSEKTVNNHRANIRDRLGMRDVASLTRYAIEHALVEPKA